MILDAKIIATHGCISLDPQIKVLNKDLRHGMDGGSSLFIPH